MVVQQECFHRLVRDFNLQPQFITPEMHGHFDLAQVIGMQLYLDAFDHIRPWIGTGLPMAATGL